MTYREYAISSSVWSTLSIIPLLLAAGCCNTVLAAGEAPSTGRTGLEHDPYAVAAIGNRGVTSPVGRLALLRKGNSICAARFTAFQRERDANAPLPQKFGEEVLSAEYDWYLPTNKPHEFAHGDVQSGHRVLSVKQNVGIGRFSFQRGSRTVKCGSMEVSWGYPNWLSLVVVSNDGFQWHGIEIAPTAWQDIKEIDLTDPALHWYRYNESKEPLGEVPLADLPGGRPTRTR